MTNKVYRKILEKRYVHAADIHRAVMAKRDNGESYETRQQIQRALPCKYSQTAMPVVNYPEGRPAVSYESKLFCAPEADILPGDVIVVHKSPASKDEYIAGEPCWWNLEGVATQEEATHAEVPLRKAKTV